MHERGGVPQLDIYRILTLFNIQLSTLCIGNIPLTDIFV